MTRTVPGLPQLHNKALSHVWMNQAMFYCILHRTVLITVLALLMACPCSSTSLLLCEVTQVLRCGHLEQRLRWWSHDTLLPCCHFHIFISCCSQELTPWAIASDHPILALFLSITWGRRRVLLSREHFLHFHPVLDLQSVVWNCLSALL